jgi:threonine aldolase
MIDLRSDTVTRPTPAMMEAMRTAELGDDGREGDPTVRRLEALAAQKTGKDAAVFMPSGTMTNLVALLTHTNRGAEVLLHEGAHIIHYENFGIANLANLYHRAIPGALGAMDLDRLEAALGTGLSARGLNASLVCMENTHNNASGAVLSLAHMAAVHALARRFGASVHTDGARLFNAAVALGVPAAEIAKHTDSVCFCISKGLSAPVGSLLCGSATFIERARHFKRMVGGNMRQSGVIAAAGIVALETMVDRLVDDHRTARRLGEGLAALDPRLVDLAALQTNIVRANVGVSGANAQQWASDLRAEGVRVSDYGSSQVRFVTHREVDAAAIDATLAAIRRVWDRHTGGARRAAAGRERPA